MTKQNFLLQNLESLQNLTNLMILKKVQKNLRKSYLALKMWKKDAQKILGDDLYFDLKGIESETMLDKTLFGFFESCYKINSVIAKHGFFL